MFSSFQNVLFVFDNPSDTDLSTYQYELYEDSDVIEVIDENPNTPLYQLTEGAIALREGSANSSVLAIPVSGSFVDEEGVEQPKNYFGRVRSIDTSGNVGLWTSLVKTDQSTPLIDEQYIVSLTADRIKAGEIEAAEITLGGANPAETIIQSKTYIDTSGASGWYIDGAGDFSLGGPEGINYTGGSITIGSDVQVTANLAADSISVGSGLNQLNINDAVGGGIGGMTLGSGGNNYWYADGNFKVGNSSNYVQWNGSSLQVVGQVTASGGTIGGWKINPTSIQSSNNLVTLNSNGLFQIGTAANNKATITSDGDFTVYGTDGVSNGVTRMYGGFFNVKTGSDPAANAANTQITFENIVFFKSTPGAFGVYISGGNNGNNAFIDVGSTGIVDNGSISCNNWFRSSGASGWRNQTYGGGIFMDDTTTVKVYANKNFYTGGTFVSPTAFFDSGSSNIAANVAIKRSYSVADKRFMSFINAANSQAGSIEYDGSSTKVRYNVSSDARIKTNIRKINSALLKVKKFNPVTFNYIDTKIDHDGFLAQELYEIYKNPVTKPEKEEDLWMMDYSSLTPILTAAIQELSEKIEYLENKINNL